LSIVEVVVFMNEDILFNDEVADFIGSLSDVTGKAAVLISDIADLIRELTNLREGDGGSGIRFFFTCNSLITSHLRTGALASRSRRYSRMFGVLPVQRRDPSASLRAGASAHLPRALPG
jgi:hypothetical protein